MPINIDTLLEYTSELDANKLDLLADPFLNSVFEDYILSNFTDLQGHVRENDWNRFGMEYMKLYTQLQEIHKEHGKLIVDYYLAKVKELYEVPEEKVEFHIASMNDREEEITMEKIDNDDVEEEVDFNQALRDEMNHLHIKNALVNGGALYKWDKLFTDIKEDLDLIDPEIYPVVTKFCKYAQFAMYAQIPVRGMEEMIVGSEQLQFPKDDEKKVVVKIKGTNFVIVCHEILKSVYDIYSEHSFCRHLPPHAQRYVRKLTSDLYYEKWAWLYGRKMFQIHIDSKYDKDKDEPYYMYLFHIFKKPYTELLQFLMEV